MKISFLPLLLLTNFCIFAQNNPDRHSSVSEDGWLSCNTSESPNQLRGNAHWIMYDLGRPYKLKSIKIWNYNHPDHLDYGIQEVILEGSVDRSTWSNYGSINLPQSTGTSSYNGQSPFPISEQIGQYILLTVGSNYGGTCAGLSEIKLSIEETSLPVDLISFNVECESNSNMKAKWKSKNEIALDKYSIMGSKDLNKWSVLKSLKARDDGSENEYSLNLDENAKGFQYFKLRSTDIDGAFKSSSVIFNECIQNDLITIGPNPTTGVINLSSKSNMSDLKVFDTSGKEVAFSSEVGNSYDLSKLSTGNYFVELTVGGKKIINKIIKN